MANREVRLAAPSMFSSVVWFLKRIMAIKVIEQMDDLAVFCLQAPFQSLEL